MMYYLHSFKRISENTIMIFTSLFLSYSSIFPASMKSESKERYIISAFETSASGKSLHKVDPIHSEVGDISIVVDSKITYQQLLGFGGSFTEATAHVLRTLSPENREQVLKAYFSDEGARYSLTRTHINSCDFSLGHYAYAMIPDDINLEHFSIQKDIQDLFPIIHEAKKYSRDGFKLIASPWTAPPWMKDNNSWIGGKLLDNYRNTWALYYAKYISSCKKEGIPIWGITVVNEPHGNGGNWESMLFTPKEMTDFVQHYLGPTLEKEGLSHVRILGYDQNRAGLNEWVDAMFENSSTSTYFAGTAIHWYESTYDYFPAQLSYAAKKAPDKYLIQTEACIDNEIPHWKDDAWYWSEEATDWGWDWAPPEQKHLHPKYVPAYRYARDIIGCLQNNVQGWIDWNMVLDRSGGPNWAKNWCIAPVIADTMKDEVYFTPLFYVMAHFSKFIRPNAYVIDSKINDEDIMTIAAENPDGSVAVVIFNPTKKSQVIDIVIDSWTTHTIIDKQALQTIVFTPN